MKMRSKIGPSTGPWGTLKTISQSDTIPLTHVYLVYHVWLHKTLKTISQSDTIPLTHVYLVYHVWLHKT